MKADNLLSSLCYFSAFFAPFLFPIIIFILGSEKVRYHAGKALWTHLVPYLSMAVGLVVGALMLNIGNPKTALIIVCIFAVIGIYYLVLNLIRGIMVLITT